MKLMASLLFHQPGNLLSHPGNLSNQIFIFLFPDHRLLHHPAIYLLKYSHFDFLIIFDYENIVNSITQ